MFQRWTNAGEEHFITEAVQNGWLRVVIKQGDELLVDATSALTLSPDNASAQLSAHGPENSCHHAPGSPLSPETALSTRLRKASLPTLRQGKGTDEALDLKGAYVLGREKGKVINNKQIHQMSGVMGAEPLCASLHPSVKWEEQQHCFCGTDVKISGVNR